MNGTLLRVSFHSEVASHRPPLHFPTSVRPLLSTFRKEVLFYLTGLVLDYFGRDIKSLIVTPWTVPGEEDSWRLTVEAVIDADWSKIAEVKRLILRDLAKQAVEWTENERKDFSERIFLELQPDN